MGLDEYRHLLGEATGHGWGFLAAYGVTWIICAAAWKRGGPKVGAYVTLFQGMAALPLALLLTALTPGPPRPSMAGMESVAILLACGQLLGLPVVIYWVARGHFARVPLGMVILVVVHFAPYSWLYATPLYLVMGAAVSVVAVLADALGSADTDRDQESEADVRPPTRTCLWTGVIMLVSSAVAAAL